VGTKIEIANTLNKFDTIGIDLVAMSVNDLIVQGAKPLLFLDYISINKIDLKKLKAIIKGIKEGCDQSECELVGGETAEMPGFYSKNKYDLAGFCVGIVDEDKLINGKKVSENDLIIALKSNGVHSNGFSLVRKIIQNNIQIDKEFEKVSHLNFYDELLKPTKIYNNVIHQMLSEDIEIKAMSHITGGGIPENLPRCIPSDFIPYINTSSWQIPTLFKFLKEKGSIPEKDFWNTFNLGVGFCLIIDKQFKEAILSICKDHDIDSWEIGKIVRKNDSTTSKFLPGILT